MFLTCTLETIKNDVSNNFKLTERRKEKLPIQGVIFLIYYLVWYNFLTTIFVCYYFNETNLIHQFCYWIVFCLFLQIFWLYSKVSIKFHIKIIPEHQAKLLKITPSNPLFVTIIPECLNFHPSLQVRGKLKSYQKSHWRNNTRSGCDNTGVNFESAHDRRPSKLAAPRCIRGIKTTKLLQVCTSFFFHSLFRSLFRIHPHSPPDCLIHPPSTGHPLTYLTHPASEFSLLKLNHEHTFNLIRLG